MPPTSAASTLGAEPTAEHARWFAEEVRPHESMLRAWLHARFPKLTDVDDLVQESYMRLFRARAHGKVGNPKSYLFATARNAAIDSFRRQRAILVEDIESIGVPSVLEETPGVAEILSRDQDLALLAEAVQSLPERCRHVIILQKLHGLSYREIAARLGISERTVNVQIAKGVLRIRDFMRARREEERP